MAQDIVSGLFGLSPYEAQQQQQAALDQQAMQFASMDPNKIPAYLAGRVGGMLGGGIAEMQGKVLPQVAQAEARQQALQGLDLSSSQSILAKAQTIQDPKMKFGLMQLADQVREREMKMEESSARTAEAKRKTASAAQKEAFVKQILANPEVNEDVKNYIRMGGDISKFIDPQTIAPGAVFGMPNFKGGFTELARGGDKSEATPQSIREYKFAQDQGFKGTYEEWLRRKAEQQKIVVNTAPPVTPITVQDPNNPDATLIKDARTGNILGAGPKLTDTGKLNVKSASAMSGLSNDLQLAEDILTGKTGAKPTASGAGTALDIAGSVVGYAPEGAAEAKQLSVIAGRLVQKVPRFEGPQSDKDVALYKEMAADVGNSKLPIATRLAALSTMKTLYSGYETGERGRVSTPGSVPSAKPNVNVSPRESTGVIGGSKRIKFDAKGNMVTQ